jgi:oligopeptide/dipeptide ABC transporter ATP-binding protein
VAGVLQLDGLRTEFQAPKRTVVAVDGVSFNVDHGEFVGLVGESGCGKSTLGLSIMRLLPRSGHIVGGRVVIGGTDLLTLPEPEMRKLRGNDVAMVFQDPMTSLNPTMTIGKQIAWPVRHHWGWSAARARARAREVLELVRMPSAEKRLDSYPHELSGGLRQRVVIAMALACDPKLLIADEPTTALDVTIQAQILDLLDDLRKRLNMAVILITHDMGVVAERTERLMVMYAGKIVENGSTARVFEAMRHPYAEALLESIPQLNTDPGQRLTSIPGMPPDLSLPVTGCRFNPRCRYASEECRASEPDLVPDEDGHSVACFNPLSKQAGGHYSNMYGPSTKTVSKSAALGGAASDEKPVLLEVRSLVKDFPVHKGTLIQRKTGKVSAVADVSFTVRHGENFGLVGESGSGKTTIGRIIACIEKPTSGSVRFDGVELTSLSHKALRRRRRDLQLMFQDPYSSLDPRMSVGATLREPLIIQGIGDRRAQWERVAELLGEVGLPRGAMRSYPHEFSGGQRQRVGFARALTVEPRLIVADEPVSALDVSVQAQVLNLMKSLQEEHSLSLIVISHDLAVVRYLANRIGVLYLGKLVEVGISERIYRQPAHHYTKSLIDAVPVPDPTVSAPQSGRLAGEIPSGLDPPSGCRFRTRCPAAQDRCRLEEPTLRPFAPGHLAACHFPLQVPLADASAPAEAP